MEEQKEKAATVDSDLKLFYESLLKQIAISLEIPICDILAKAQ